MQSRGGPRCFTLCLDPDRTDCRNKNTREKPPESVYDADEALISYGQLLPSKFGSIENVIPAGKLQFTEKLDIPEEKIKKWNKVLVEIFADAEVHEKWHTIFRPSYLLKNEKTLFAEILGE